MAIQWLIGYLWLLCCSPSIFRSICVKMLKKKKKKKKKKKTNEKKKKLNVKHKIIVRRTSK